jgi:hypothetical protein
MELKLNDFVKNILNEYQWILLTYNGRDLYEGRASSIPQEIKDEDYIVTNLSLVSHTIRLTLNKK